MFFNTINYLKSGNEVQRRAYQVIKKLNILNDLSRYTPTLCGTIPISIDVKGSDLDIILEVYDLKVLKDEVYSLYGNLDGFVLRELVVRSVPTIVSNFHFRGFEFELFAQPSPVQQQNAYRHMIIENNLLLKNPHIRSKIISLKEKGIKTEPAFAQVFELTGDPYDELLILGREIGIIN
ncbi:DUF4269 domain-containing protein [Paenibacillus alginolyticus]|uniref:DUF4269 domain-containing protein n=1 Tax=Paenibacillus alginolyticus TaxID=59839 RepID=A0ABT4GQK0_9BACL|nr:DUF4269 domain-containing protein [Paenibacillus alginolyticus]MCY9698331.1 DUF4269 domain-containing protein [Paenibacillus alginolyticus]MEC0148913.1 DUF4269 domain-containing protein [Paenibacillus alginolyticus]